MKKHFFSLVMTTIFCFSLVGCGQNTTNGSTSGNNDATLEDNLENDADNVIDDVGTAAEDIVDGVGNAVEDLVGGNSFDNYSDAHDYFMETMGNYHSDANFEIRNESKDLFDYQEGSKGYRFSLYDTSSNPDGELFGEFYVDATSGMIYRLEDDGTIKEYPTKNGTSTTSKKQNSSDNNTTAR